MRAPLWFTTTVLTAAVFAGCIDDGQDGDEDTDVEVPTIPIDWALRAVDNTEPHDHTDPLQHQQRSTANFQLLGHDPLIDDYHGETAGAYACGDASEVGERIIGVVHSFTTDVALVVVDLTDPMAPIKLGELVLPHTFVYDVAVTPDGRFAALGTNDPDANREKDPEPPIMDRLYAQATWADGPDHPHFKNACTGEITPVDIAPHLQGPLDEAEYGPGVVLVDLADPTAPTVADYSPLAGLGAHSIYATDLGDGAIILASVTNLAQHASYYAFFTLLDHPLGTKLVLESTYTPEPPGGTAQPVINGHVDGWIMTHPVTGVDTGFLANWDGGLILVDLSNLKTPRTIGRWTSFGGVGNLPYDSNQGSIHEALPIVGTWDGKHYTIIGQEVIGRPDATPTGVIYIMDTTDPTTPTPVAAWSLPVDPVWDESLLYSTHYVTLLDRTLFVTMYHGGVWAVDLSDPTSPESVGVFVPAEVSPKPPTTPMPGFDFAPFVLEAEVLRDGNLLVWDANTGVYVVSFDAGMAIPDVEEWDVAFV